MEILTLITQIICIILCTDLFSGLAHWAEDTYGNPKSRFKWLAKNIILPNIEHHKYPRKMLQNSFINRIGTSFLIVVLLGIIFYFTGILNWQTIFFLTYACFINEIHSWAHKTEKENGKIITILQKTGIVQSRRMHGHHHSSPFDINYCILTNYLNYSLDKIRFWRFLEFLLFQIGIKPLRGTESRLDS